MYTTQSVHNRDRLGRGRRVLVNDRGLGVTVTQTTQFDPTRMAVREKYWFDLYYKQAVDDLAKQYRDAGYLDGLSGLGASKYTSGMVMTGKIPGLVNILNIVSKVPIIGGMFCGIFGGCDKPHIPWGEIYSQAASIVRPYAHQAAIDEETARIAEEKQTIEATRVAAVEKGSQTAAAFKLPEGAIGIKSGALVLALKGGPVEKRG